MNREFRKSNAPAEELNPPATEPDHLTNVPDDELIPKDHHDSLGAPLYSLRDSADLIRESITPPPTPPELEPGRTGCHLFREVEHYVDPVYQDPELRRIFTTKLILGNLLSQLPAVLIMVGLMTLGYKLDYMLLNNTSTVVLIFVGSLLAVLLYIYFVGLFRKAPLIYIAVAVRVILNTTVLVSSMLVVHIIFLHTVDHPLSEQDEYNKTIVFKYVSYVHLHDEHDHSPPYMSVLIVALMAIVKGIISVLLLKYNYTMDHSLIPFVIYTTCYSVSAILVTIVLNDGFRYRPGYDIFQVITGCGISSTLLMRTPHFVERLYDGKVCPLRKGELLYATIHYGL